MPLRLLSSGEQIEPRACGETWGDGIGGGSSYVTGDLKLLATRLKIPIQKPFEDLPKKAQAALCEGLIDDRADERVEHADDEQQADEEHRSGREGAAKLPAIVNFNDGTLAVRDVKTDGYGVAIRSTGSPDSAVQVWFTMSAHPRELFQFRVHIWAPVQISLLSAVNPMPAAFPGPAMSVSSAPRLPCRASTG